MYLVFIYCFACFLYLLEAPLDVRTYEKTRDQQIKTLAGEDKVIKQPKHPKEDEIGRKSSLEEKWLAPLNDGRYGQHACGLSK